MLLRKATTREALALPLALYHALCDPRIAMQQHMPVEPSPFVPRFQHGAVAQRASGERLTKTLQQPLDLIIFTSTIIAPICEREEPSPRGQDRLSDHPRIPHATTTRQAGATLAAGNPNDLQPCRRNGGMHSRLAFKQFQRNRAIAIGHLPTRGAYAIDRSASGSMATHEPFKRCHLCILSSSPR